MLRDCVSSKCFLNNLRVKKRFHAPLLQVYVAIQYYDQDLTKAGTGGAADPVTPPSPTLNQGDSYEETSLKMGTKKLD